MRSGHGPFVFNLGEGVVPQTPPEHVAVLADIVRAWPGDGRGMSRIAVVLFNLGGPDSLDAVEPFLRNLFRDPAIIRAPAPVRHLLARLIARRRGPKARDIYRTIGGRSPLLAETEAQAAASAARWPISARSRSPSPCATGTR